MPAEPDSSADTPLSRLEVAIVTCEASLERLKKRREHMLGSASTDARALVLEECDCAITASEQSIAALRKLRPTFRRLAAGSVRAH
jgi:hypothetical protein